METMAKKETHKVYFTITELAEEFSIDKDLIRRYENKKLLSPAISKSNSSLYNPCDKIRLKFIIQARHADYSMGKIEELIGKISPHLSESDKLKESISYAEEKYNAMREGINAVDVLEKINISCDLELLAMYLQNLNRLKLTPHILAHTGRPPSSPGRARPRRPTCRRVAPPRGPPPRPPVLARPPTRAGTADRRGTRSGPFGP